MKKLLILALLILAPTVSSAAETQGSGANPYTECGIGAALFPTIGWAAALSNIVWDWGSTALSSALTTPENCNAKKVNTAKLILETLPELEKDIAMGNGKYLTALNKTMGCDATAQGSINANLRASYVSVVSDKAYSTKSNIDRANDLYHSVKEVISAPALKNTCTVAL
jgi:hypothetical protein